MGPALLRYRAATDQVWVELLTGAPVATEPGFFDSFEVEAHTSFRGPRSISEHDVVVLARVVGGLASPVILPSCSAANP